MTHWQFKTPVVFVIFNRPETTARVFAAIAEARPRKLLVVADGPREHHPGDSERCEATRSIIDQVDWDCDVSTQYADSNMGSTRRVPTGLDWAFSTEEEAVILEDDCLPHPLFFQFCEELLARYREDERIAQIGGSNLQFGHDRTSHSYYFSRFTHIWGWATWRRAWRTYDVELRDWPELRAGAWLKEVLGDRRQERYWRRIFDSVSSGRIDAWDYQWTFACWRTGAFTAVPNVNLVSNIGFGRDSSHTRVRSPLADVPTRAMRFPLDHPDRVEPNADADAFTVKEVYKPLGPRLLDKARRDPSGFIMQLQEETRRRLRSAVSR